MDQYTKNRFKYIDELSDEELLAMQQESIREINNLLDIINDKKVNRMLKSEIENSDINYEREKLGYINYLIEARNIKEKVK